MRPYTILIILLLGYGLTGWAEEEVNVGISDPYAVYDVPNMDKPVYLEEVTDPVFGTKFRRVVGDPGTDIITRDGDNIGTWGKDARHHYSKDQAWNADESLLMMQNRDGGSPTYLFLDGSTYEVLFGEPSKWPGGDRRWHQAIEYRNILIFADGDELCWFDVRQNRKTRIWSGNDLPISDIDGIGMGEGNTSDDGRLIILTNQSEMFVVDMDSWPDKRVGPLCSIRDGKVSNSATLAHTTMSPSGKYAVLKIHDGSESVFRVYDVDPLTLALTPRILPDTFIIGGCHRSGQDGFIHRLNHEDVSVNPFDNNEDVAIGRGKGDCDHSGRSATDPPEIITVNGGKVGNTIMVRLRDGQTTSLTEYESPQGIEEATSNHNSARNIHKTAWMFIGYKTNKVGNRYNGEIVALKKDGSGNIRRLVHHRTGARDIGNNYRAEAHTAPSPSGSKLIWASNWLYQGDGSNDEPQGYVLELEQVGVLILGDADGNGHVDMADTIKTAQFVVGIRPVPFYESAADVDGEDGVTMKDAILIARMAIGAIE